MRPAFQQAIDYTKSHSRLFLNILFWSIIMVPNYVGILRGTEKMPYGMGWALTFETLDYLLMITISYANNLFLIPTYLEKKKRFKYILSALGLVLLFSLAFASKSIILYEFFPKLNDFVTITGNAKLTSHWPFNISKAFTVFIFTFMVYCGMLAFWLFIFTAAWYVRNYTLQQKKLEEIRKKQTEIELNFLKNQLNPHFLFNTLNNLYSLALKKSDDAPDIILKLSSLLRYMLYESDAGVVSSEKEKEMMQAYIDLELLRVGNKDNLHFTISTDHSYSIPPLIWLPVLENIFKHGTRMIGDDMYVDYRFYIQDDVLTINSKNRVKSNGEEEKVPGGIGLDNLKKRLEILYPGRYKFNSFVRLNNAEKNNDYITELTINLNS